MPMLPFSMGEVTNPPLDSYFFQSQFAKIVFYF